MLALLLLPLLVAAQAERPEHLRDTIRQAGVACMHTVNQKMMLQY